MILDVSPAPPPPQTPSRRRTTDGDRSASHGFCSTLFASLRSCMQSTFHVGALRTSCGARHPAAIDSSLASIHERPERNPSLQSSTFQLSLRFLIPTQSSFCTETGGHPNGARSPAAVKAPNDHPARAAASQTGRSSLISRDRVSVSREDERNGTCNAQPFESTVQRMPGHPSSPSNLEMLPGASCGPVPTMSYDRI